MNIESVELKNEVVTIGDTAEKIERHDDWQTPDSIFDPLNAIFQFNVDAAASPDNTKCGEFFTEEMDALNHDWCFRFGRRTVVWCNPPYKDLAPWVQKAHDEACRGATVVMLIPNSRGRGWYKGIIIPAKQKGYCRTYSYGPGRISFVDPHPGAKRSNPKQDNLLVVFTPPMPEKWSLD